MRKIEKQMLQAIKDRRSWKSGNTEVLIDGDMCHVCLHGNLIASNASGGPFGAAVGMFRTWPTMTTSSRLHALGIRASIKNGVAHIDGKPV